MWWWDYYFVKCCADVLNLSKKWNYLDSWDNVRIVFGVFRHRWSFIHIFILLGGEYWFNLNWVKLYLLRFISLSVKSPPCYLLYRDEYFFPLFRDSQEQVTCAVLHFHVMCSPFFFVKAIHDYSFVLQFIHKILWLD